VDLNFKSEADFQRAFSEQREGEPPITPQNNSDSAIIGRVIGKVVKAATAQLREQLKAAEARIVELEKRPVIADGGVWQVGKKYVEGMIVTHNGAGWFCRGSHYATGAAPDPKFFRLFVKSDRR
jgi:hypothetical protein